MHVQAAIDCPSCGGREGACAECDSRGWLEFYRCPNRLIDPETLGMLDLLVYAHDGLLPVHGGLLDQAQTFLECFRLFRSELARKRERDRRDLEMKAKHGYHRQ